jgi:hypothetical protein
MAGIMGHFQTLRMLTNSKTLAKFTAMVGFSSLKQAVLD